MHHYANTFVVLDTFFNDSALNFSPQISAYHVQFGMETNILDSHLRRHETADWKKVVLLVSERAIDLQKGKQQLEGISSNTKLLNDCLFRWSRWCSVWKYIPVLKFALTFQFSHQLGSYFKSLVHSAFDVQDCSQG